MRIESNSKVQVPILKIVWGECFLWEGVLWLKGRTTCVRLSDGEIQEFEEDTLVVPVEAKVTY